MSLLEAFHQLEKLFFEDMEEMSIEIYWKRNSKHSSTHEQLL